MTTVVKACSQCEPDTGGTTPYTVVKWSMETNSNFHFVIKRVRKLQFNCLRLTKNLLSVLLPALVQSCDLWGKSYTWSQCVTLSGSWGYPYCWTGFCPASRNDGSFHVTMTFSLIRSRAISLAHSSMPAMDAMRKIWGTAIYIMFFRLKKLCMPLVHSDI